MEHELDPEIRYVRPKRWSEISGVGERATGDLIANKQLRAVKVGRAVLIDLDHGLKWLAAQPAAQRTAQKPRTRRAATAA